jgi:hypothetical protein
MMLGLQLFAILKHRAGRDSVEVDLNEGATVAAGKAGKKYLAD